MVACILCDRFCFSEDSEVALDIIGCFIIGYNGYPFPLTQNMPPDSPEGSGEGWLLPGGSACERQHVGRPRDFKRR